MQYTTLGHSGIKVSKLCLGGMSFGEDEREMIPMRRQCGMAITPYGSIASSHLCRPAWESASTRGTTKVKPTR